MVQTTDHQQRSAQFLCLDLLLAFVQHMAERAAQVRELAVVQAASLKPMQPAAPWSSVRSYSISLGWRSYAP